MLRGMLVATVVAFVVVIVAARADASRGIPARGDGGGSRVHGSEPVPPAPLAPTVFVRYRAAA